MRSVKLNKLDESIKENSAKEEKLQINKQPKQEVVRKGGKTVIRTMIPDF